MESLSSSRAADLYAEHEQLIHRRTDRLFFYLLLLQWIAGMCLAVIVSPYTWIGEQQRVNEHVLNAVFLGGAIISLPVYLAHFHSGKALTRHVIAIAHMLMVGLLVNVTGGRIETHFHYFGSLAFLAFYRDWRVVVTATAIAGAEHLLRGIYFPLSIYGVFTASPWRTLEHIWWVVFEDIVLIIYIAQNLRAMAQIAERQADMESIQADIEGQVVARTSELQKEVLERQQAEQRIREVAEELQRSNRELESFASVASHDLQEPLRKIQAFSDRLRKKLGSELQPDAQQDLDRVLNAASRMQRLIEDLLVYSRVTTKAKPFAQVDLNTVAREVLGDLEVRVEKSGGRVEVSPLPTVWADAMQMRQLLQNLIANALKFKKLEESSFVQIRANETADGFFSIAVVDNGIGFEEKYSERIFGVFQRLHDQKQYEGTGIGLAVCKKIVERHGGTIVATSPGVGAGAEFRFTLPINRTQTEKVAA